MSTELDVASVRLLIADVSTDPTKQLLTDAQVGALLDIEGGNVKLAAAQALETIARSEVLVSKVIKTQDLDTDGAKVAAELRASAASLRAQVATELNQTNEGYFEVIDLVNTPDSDWRCW